jgi:hypothetical protein
MLGDVSLLFHQLTEAVGRTEPAVVHVTGLASSGKERLLSALSRYLEPLGITVRMGPVSAPSGVATLCVHAETDIEALVEGGAAQETLLEQARADVVVPVDWEPVDRSVQRVVDALIGRGFPIAGAGV